MNAQIHFLIGRVCGGGERIGCTFLCDLKVLQALVAHEIGREYL